MTWLLAFTRPQNPKFHGLDPRELTLTPGEIGLCVTGYGMIPSGHFRMSGRFRVADLSCGSVPARPVSDRVPLLPMVSQCTLRAIAARQDKLLLRNELRVNDWQIQARGVSGYDFDRPALG